MKKIKGDILGAWARLLGTLALATSA